MGSLRTRLLVAASLTLVVFLALCGFSLGRAFETTARQTQLERMQSLSYALLGNAEPNEYGDLTLSNTQLPDARLERPQSGLEAALLSESSALLWGSPSLRDDMPTPPLQPVGEWRFEQLPDRFVLLFGMRYADESTGTRRYTLMLMEDSEAYQTLLDAYQRTLWLWLGTASAALLLLQGAVLRWSLRPLRKLVGELQDVERGGRVQIEGRYPDELQPLTQGLNTMIAAERNRQTRYRNALGDLAHSLKTPLAVLRGVAERPQAADSHRLLGEQLQRMQHIVDNQLQRAASRGGARALAEAVALKPLVDKTANALAKVYSNRALRFDLAVPAALRVRADPGDLYDLLGNLIDNAAKYGRGRVRVAASRPRENQLLLIVEDDGAGFPEDAEALLERGVRADTREDGQGLGLGAVRDVVEAYGGRLTLERSNDLGGARVCVTMLA
ncbi:MAG: ATP-binding protein [Stagnimonas sp.]|nr:ATP-binding protein [Stagnimonas sp.]